MGRKRGAPDEQKPPRVKPQRITDEIPPEATFNSYVNEMDLEAYRRDIKMTPEMRAEYERMMNSSWTDAIFGGEPGRTFEGLSPRFGFDPASSIHDEMADRFFGSPTGRYRGRPEPRFGRERDMDPRERAYRESQREGTDPSEVYERIITEEARAEKLKELRARFGDRMVLDQLLRIVEEMGDLESILMVLEPDVHQASRTDDGRYVHEIDYSAIERRMMRDWKP